VNHLSESRAAIPNNRQPRSTLDACQTCGADLQRHIPLYTVDVDGGLPVKLPMPTAGAGDFSPDSKKIVYSPLFRDFRTCKRYEGGWAQDLYIFDLKKHDVRKIAASKRTERDPMWIGDKIFFVSDRDGTLNLFRYDPARDDASQGAPVIWQSPHTIEGPKRTANQIWTTNRDNHIVSGVGQFRLARQTIRHGVSWPLLTRA
jgi:hypothetical protein